jgi:hypothetical protein
MNFEKPVIKSIRQKFETPEGKKYIFNFHVRELEAIIDQ